MNIIFFDSNINHFFPLTFTKPFGELRMGILTFKERWEKVLDTKVSYKTEEYLSEKYPISSTGNNYYVNPTFFPNQELVYLIQNLALGEAIFQDNVLVAAFASEKEFEQKKFNTRKRIFDLLKLNRCWDLFLNNHLALQYDYDLITNGRESQPISSETNVKGTQIFLEEGVKIDYAILNAETGPIYLGKDSEVMEGSLVRGGLALCQGAKLNMGSKIYGATTIGPYSKVGGEINNSILTGFSNKGHEGFLGNSVLGEWCNLGADTNNSNLKNNYTNVKMWDYEKDTFLDTGQQFCGLIMGDHSKTAINTQFNTGTTVGVCSNIFHTGFPPNIIASFCWGGGRNSAIYSLEKGFETAEKVMKRRGKQLTQSDKRILEYLYTMKNNNV